MAEKKAPGQAAYERDVKRKPLYPDGKPRRKWEELDEVSRWTWSKNPTDRA